MHLAHSYVAAERNVMVYYLQLSCMCLCQCLTYSSGQTLHPQVQYTEAVAWQAGERTAYPTMQGPKDGAPGQY